MPGHYDPQVIPQRSAELQERGTTHVAVAPDGTFLLAFDHATCRVIEVETGAIRFQIPVDTYRPLGHISADSLAMATYFKKRVEIRATASGELLGAVPSLGYLEDMGRHLLGPRGMMMIGAAEKRGCVAFDVASGDVTRDLLSYWPERLALSGNGLHLITGGQASLVDDGYVTLVDVRQGKQISETRMAYSIEEVDISYDGTRNAVYDYHALEVSDCPPQPKFSLCDFTFIERGAAMLAITPAQFLRWECSNPRLPQVADHPVRDFILRVSASDAGDLVALKTKECCHLVCPQWSS